ncbi:hypothetical protein RYX36_016942, partial [Vicia faba]
MSFVVDVSCIPMFSGEPEFSQYWIGITIIYDMEHSSCKTNDTAVSAISFQCSMVLQSLPYLRRSCLDDDEAFLTTADSAIRLLSKATRTVSEWKGLEYRAAFPILKPAGANFYPLTWTKWYHRKIQICLEFNLWNDNLAKDQQTEATSYFTVIKRHNEFILDSGLSNDKVASSKDLYIVPYSQEYKSLLAKSAKLLHKAGDITNSTSLKKLLHSKADAFLSNDYYESDIAWMELDSKLDITIGPYETYEDKLFGYK